MRLRSGKRVLDSERKGRYPIQSAALSASPGKRFSKISGVLNVNEAPTLGQGECSQDPWCRANGGEPLSDCQQPEWMSGTTLEAQTECATQWLNNFRESVSERHSAQNVFENLGLEYNEEESVVENKCALDESPHNGTSGSANSHLSNSQASHAHNSGIRPHDKKVLFVLKMGASFLVLIYFFVPAVIKLNPWLMSEAVFLHRLRLPFFDLNKPAELGLTGAFSFKIQSTDDIKIGAWHILPESLQGQKVSTAREFAKLLGTGKNIIIYLHGNAGTRGASHRVSLYKVLSKADFHVIAIDYRGYGDSEGVPSEEGLISDGLAIYDWVKSRCGNVSVFFWGHSLGTAVATQVAQRACQRGTPPSGVVLESPITNIQEAAVTHPLSMPFKYMPYFTWVFIEALKYNNLNFASDKNIGSVTVPVLILHAKDDYVVPFEQGEKLYQVARDQKEQGAVYFIAFEAEHNYGHEHIHLAPNLPQIIEDFISGRLHS